MPRQFKLARKMKNIPLKVAAKDLGVAQSTLIGRPSITTCPPTSSWGLPAAATRGLIGSPWWTAPFFPLCMKRRSMWRTKAGLSWMRWKTASVSLTEVLYLLPRPALSICCRRPTFCRPALRKSLWRSKR